MSRLKNVIRWMVNAMTCMLLVVLILVIYGKCVLMFSDNKYPNYFGYTLFEVASGSMEPTLYIHDVILVKITKENLNKGDIIAFLNEKSIITHRIVFIDGDVITVKGDNNNAIDSPIKREQVVGKIVKIFPKFGVWKKIVTEPKILVLIFVTLILFDFALSYNDNDENKKSKKETKKKKELELSKEEKIIEKEVPHVKEKTEPRKKDAIDGDELLEFTRKIDIEEINKLIENDNIQLTTKEIKSLKKEIENTLEKTQEMPKLKEKEKKFLEYTMRLDLSQIQKKIKDKVK